MTKGELNTTEQRIELLAIVRDIVCGPANASFLVPLEDPELEEMAQRMVDAAFPRSCPPIRRSRTTALQDSCPSKTVRRRGRTSGTSSTQLPPWGPDIPRLRSAILRE
jgi:hypothetical protein